MGIYSYKSDLFKRRSINEAEISNDDDEEKKDDEEDYTAGAEDAADDDSNDDADTGDDEGGGDDEDYTAGAEEAGDDDGDNEDEGSDDEGASDDDGEDYTAGAEDAADDDSSDEGGDEGGDNDSSDEGGDEGDDYTAGAEDAGSDGDLGGDDEGGEGEDEGEGGDEGGEGEEGEDSTFEDLQKIESELFSNLSPEQVEIKNKELKQRFIDVYGTIASVLIRINDIPKTDLNIDVLHFVTDKLMELRDLVDYNITKAFATKTYIENSINYQLCLSTLSSISDIIDSVAGAEEDENHKAGLDNEDDDGVIVGGTSTEVDTDMSTELGDRMIDGQTKGDALNEMGVLKKERKRK